MTGGDHIRDRVLMDVRRERLRQDTLKAEGRFQYTCADNGLSLSEKLACLTEELGEVAQEVLTQSGRRLARDTTGSRENLRKELVQVAAVAVAWIEGMDSYYYQGTGGAHDPDRQP